MLKNVWLRLIAPHPSIEDIEQRRQSQLLAIIALFILLFQIISLPLLFSSRYTGANIGTYMIGTAMAMFVYFFNRRGRYKIAAYLLIIISFISIHIGLISGENNLIFYAGIVFIISGILLPLKATMSLFFVSIILQVAFAIYAPQSFIIDRVDPLLFLLFMVPFIFMFIYHRLGVEKERQEELEAAFEAIKKSELRWRSLLSAAPDTVSLIERDYTFRFVNSLPPDTPPEKMLNQKVQDYVHLDYYDYFIKHLERAFASKTPIRCEILGYDVYGKEQWYAITANAIRDGENASQLFVVSHNITKKKASEQQLVQERNLLRTLIDGIPDSIYIKDVDGKFILNNRTSVKKLGFQKPEDLIGKSDFDLFPEELAQEFRNNDQAVIASNKAYVTYEEPLVDLEKRIVGQVLSSYIPVRNNEGEVTHLIGINRDITKQKQIEKQQLELGIQRERIKVLEEVVSDLSHDIKTPLASIKTAVYILQNHPEKREKYLFQLDMLVNRLTKLVEDVLAMARLDKKGHFTFNSISLSELNTHIGEIVHDFEARLLEKNILFSQYLHEDDILIIINETELGRGIANLLENAVNYTATNGAIAIETTVRGDEFVMSVSDTGIGIDKADQAHIFERFFRADKARSEAGTGLGLAIASRVIELHGGRIEVDSEIGKGSVFRIYLPVLRKEQLEMPHRDSEIL
jgi:PAS domain S-box-containing protein